MRDGLREIVDRELSGLRWQPRNRSAVLARTKGEPKMKKRMSAGLILAVALTLAAVSALAVYALTRSPEAEAKYQARQAVMDAYGLTAETMGLFHAEHEETDDGWRVTFRALANIDPGRAGVYTVEKTADGRTAAWSHDGLDPALWRGEDLTAPAYGQEQLLYALNEGQEEALALARESAASGPMQTPPAPAPVNEDASVWMDVREVEPGPEDMSLAEAKEIMRAAAQEELGLSGAGAAAVGAAEDFDEVGTRLVEDNAGRRMWEFAVEVDLGDTHISGGAFVDACTGEIVLFDYESGGNG